MKTEYGYLHDGVIENGCTRNPLTLSSVPVLVHVQVWVHILGGLSECSAEERYDRKEIMHISVFSKHLWPSILSTKLPPLPPHPPNESTRFYHAPHHVFYVIIMSAACGVSFIPLPAFAECARARSLFTRLAKSQWCILSVSGCDWSIEQSSDVLMIIIILIIIIIIIIMYTFCVPFIYTR